MALTLTQEAIAAALAAARAAITDYSEFYSSMVPDDALEKVVTDALNAALGVLGGSSAAASSSAPLKGN